MTFSEKIQSRKLALQKRDSMFADKYSVREYVKDKVGEKYLIPLLWVSEANDAKKIPSFENHVVIKTTHGSGGNHLEFFPNNKAISEVREKFQVALNDKYIGSYFGETQYDHIVPRVIVEEKLHLDGVVPEDFKFHVFKGTGTPKAFLQVDFDRFSSHKRNYYDETFQLMDMNIIYPNGKFNLPERSVLVEMRELAFKLLGDLEYARIDLYLFQGNIYFGEITLTPGSGFERFSNKKYDKAWGALWK